MSEPFAKCPHCGGDVRLYVIPKWTAGCFACTIEMVNGSIDCSNCGKKEKVDWHPSGEVILSLARNAMEQQYREHAEKVRESK